MTNLTIKWSDILKRKKLFIHANEVYKITELSGWHLDVMKEFHPEYVFTRYPNYVRVVPYRDEDSAVAVVGFGNRIRRPRRHRIHRRRRQIMLNDPDFLDVGPLGGFVSGVGFIWLSRYPRYYLAKIFRLLHEGGIVLTASERELIIRLLTKDFDRVMKELSKDGRPFRDDIFTRFFKQAMKSRLLRPYMELPVAILLAVLLEGLQQTGPFEIIEFYDNHPEHRIDLIHNRRKNAW